MIEIVTFQKEYRDAVIDVILPIQQTEFGIPIFLEAQPDLMDISRFYQTGLGNFWVAKLNAEIIGTIGLLDIGNSEGALRKMFVKSQYRGPAHKAAFHLLNTLVKWCSQVEVRDVFLGTTAQFFAAHRFYEKNGFHEIAKDQLPLSFQIMAVDTKFYHLSVNLE